MYAVIMAGGGGTRLWPLSTPARPKPFLPLLGKRSLLQRTADRLLDGSELGMSAVDLTVVTDQRYAGLVHEQLPSARVLAEPSGRNTAPAIALAALAIERPDDEVMLVVPADHTIDDEPAYRAVLRRAHDELARGALGVEAPLVTLGVKPSRPATDYGYLVPDLERGGSSAGGHVLKAFEEKPNAARAGDLVRQPGIAWNAGIFLWTRAAIRAALGRYTGLLPLIEGAMARPGLLADAYERVQPISIDYAVMEGAAADGRVLMASMDVGWSDLGSWVALVDALVGGYRETARVVPAGHEVALGEDDLVVRRDQGRLVLAVGPASTMRSEQPMALLPAASGHRPAIGALLDRVNNEEGAA
ncbi:MAG TPA: sugar phosphate nucleotidyltransferase [Candidatus Limnocylindrales bacterium]|nr:sugar phosphate nucleotidyltransferase [Candidatus Limnocylindrales bacterium]